jgi:hypothetical protein
MAILKFGDLEIFPWPQDVTHQNMRLEMLISMMVVSFLATERLRSNEFSKIKCINCDHGKMTAGGAIF